jgi:hypothetical protein
MDTPLIRFSVLEESNTPEIELLWVNEEGRHFLPLELHSSPE